MPDKSELDHRKRVGEAAARMMDSEIFKGCLKALRDNAIAEFASVDPSDHVALSVARIRYEVAESFVNEFHKVANDGLKAAHDLKALD